MKKIERIINLQNHTRFPRKVILITFLLRGCKFEISTPIEQFRIEEYGNEEDFTRLIIKEIRPNDVIFDIGACVGLISIHAGRKGASVVAFEPDDSIRNRLIKNFQLNRINNYRIIKWAVSDEAGTAKLYTDGLEGWSPSFLEFGKSGEKIIETNSIDNALKSKEIPIPNLIKIDVEGAEFLVLKGMKNLLNSHQAPRKIFIEIHPDYLETLGSSFKDIDHLLLSSNYRSQYFVQRNVQMHAIYTKLPTSLNF